MSNQLHLIPTRTDGASAFGWHFLSTWRKCRTLWFNTFLRPHRSGGTGCEPRYTGKALLVGSYTHSGIEAWYRSGWQDGKYQLEAAIEAARASHAARLEEVHPDDDPDTLLSDVEDLLIAYHNWYTEESPCWPTYRIASDDKGEPLIEREFHIDLGYRGYTFTARLDAVAWYNPLHTGLDQLISLETKTTDVSQLSRLIRRFAIDGQVTGQIWLLQSAFPDAEHGGLHLNAIVKRAKKLDPFVRDPYHRSDEELEKFRIDTVRTLRDIDEHVDEYHTLLQGGMDHNEAARFVFDRHPDGYQCVGTYMCPFLDSCLSDGHEDSWAASHTRPRSTTNSMNMRGHNDG